MKLDINEKYTGDFLTAEEFNLLVNAINNYKIGELANVDPALDNSTSEDSFLIKEKVSNKVVLKKISDLIRKEKDTYTLGELTNVDTTIDGTTDTDVALVRYAGENKYVLKPLSEIMTPVIGLQRYVTLQNNLKSKNIAINKGDSCILNFTFLSQERYSSADKFLNTDERGWLQVFVQNANYTEYTLVEEKYINSGEETKLNITDYIVGNNISVMLKCKGEVSEEETSALVYSVTVTSLNLNADNFRWWIPNYTDITIPFTIAGNINKKLMLTVTGDNYYAEYRETVGTGSFTETPFNYTIPKPDKEGIYTFTAYISNVDETLETKSITYNFIVVNSGSQSKYLVVNNVSEGIVNFEENKVFDYAIYDGDYTTSNATISVLKDSRTLYSDELDAIETQTKQTFNYSPEINDDSVNFNIIINIEDVYGQLTDNFSVKVNNIYSFGSVAGASFYLNAKLRSNSQANKKMIVNEITSEEINATWTNFNWANDGWVEDSNGHKTLTVMAKERLTIDYYPFKNEAARIGKTIEIDYQIDNVTNFDEPCIRICSNVEEYVGLNITPDYVCQLTQALKNTVNQGVATSNGERIRMTLVIMPNAYGNANFNICIIYINGKKNREFAYANNDYFSTNSPITIGSDYADTNVYAIRIYDKALTSAQVLQNYINLLSDNDEKQSIVDDNDVLDINGNDVDFDNTVDQYNIMVLDTDLPYYLDQSDRIGNLEIYFSKNPDRNVTITNLKVSGQGTSSKKYYRWNQKYKFNDESIIQYADGSTGTKKWQMTPDIPAAKVFTAKKNFASPMQSHKMGSVNSVTDLYKEMGLKNEAIELDSTKRISVYQLPFIMFTRHLNEEGEYVYQFEGSYTMGPDKGDENTFGFDEDKFPNVIALEGSDNSPLPTLFRVPWSSRMEYNPDEEAFQYNGQNIWDVNAGNIDNIDKWIPAYQLAYECSNRIRPFNGTLDDLNNDIITYRATGYDYWIAKEGDVNQYNQYYYESSEGRFISSNINLINQLSEYINIDNINNFSNEEKNELFINARIAKFRDEAPLYFDITDSIFHRNWIEINAGTDQRAKNTYPYLLTNKWRWLFDDTDTIFDTTNQGQPLKKYSVEVHDEDVWNGQTSNFWNLLDLAYQEEIKTEMHLMLAAMERLGGLKNGNSFDKLYAFYKKYYLDSSQYFPATIVNADAKYSYETAKLNPQYTNDTDPMTQSLGDHYSAESAWITKRIFYIMSKYSYGVFSANGNDTIIVRAAGDLINYYLTPAIDLYPNIANGTSIVRGNRTYAGDTTVMTIDLGGSADQQNIIQGASWYTSIGDWHDKNVKGTMTVQGQRLQELILGSKTDDITIKIDSLEVKESCKSLQKILLSNISTLNGNLDLSHCTHLREIYADGTNLAQINLPKGSLEHIEYPNSNQYLTLFNYPLLTKSNIILGSCAYNIIDVIIADCPQAKPVEMLSDILEAQRNQGANHNLRRIRLTGIDETFDASNGARVLSNLAQITDGTYSGLDSNGVEISGSFPTLEGTITLNCKAYEDNVNDLRNKFNNLNLIVNGEFYIRFKDTTTQNYITKLWGDGIGVTRSDLAKIKGGNMEQISFRYSYNTANTVTTTTHFNHLEYKPVSMNGELGEYFDELKYFTGIKRVFLNNTKLKGVIFPPNVRYTGGYRFGISGATIEYVKYMDSDNTEDTLVFNGGEQDRYTRNRIDVVYVPSRFYSANTYTLSSTYISELYINRTTPPIYHLGYGESADNVINVFVPKGYKSLYDTDEYWNRFYGKIEEYDYSKDGRGIIPYMDYTTDLTNMSSTYSNGRIETVLTPRNAKRDLVYESDIPNFVTVGQTGKVTFGNFGVGKVKIYNKHKPSMSNTLTITNRESTSGYTYNGETSYNTGIYLKDNTKIWIKVAGWSKSTIMGTCGVSWDSTNGFYLCFTTNTNLRLFNGSNYSITVPAGGELEIMMENGKATVNGVEYELTPRTGNTDSPIFLFSNGYAMDEGNFKGKFYDAKIYEGDELIAHFKPNTEGNLTQLIH